MVQVTVRQAAQRLRLSDGRVRALIRDGSLGAARVGSQFVILDADLAQFMAQRREAHVRSFSRQIAWAAADLADGGSAQSISDSERSRLRSRLDHTTADLPIWMRRLHALGDEKVQCAISAERLAALLADHRVVRSGSFATNLASDQLVSREGTIWVASRESLGELRRDYGLLRSSNGAVTCRIAGASEDRLGIGMGNAFRLVVVADLASEGDDRSQSAAASLLREVIEERSWRGR